MRCLLLLAALVGGAVSADPGCTAADVADCEARCWGRQELPHPDYVCQGNTCPCVEACELLTGCTGVNEYCEERTVANCNTGPCIEAFCFDPPPVCLDGNPPLTGADGERLRCGGPHPTCPSGTECEPAGCCTEPCPTCAMLDPCDLGQKVDDATGCYLCECNDPCPICALPMDCQYGQKYDDQTGCQTCDCNPNPIPREERCLLPLDTGECDGYSERFFYDYDSMKCHSFGYGGCGGNANNFMSMDECKRYCHTCPAVLCKYPCPSGKFAMDEYGCQTCLCEAPPPPVTPCEDSVPLIYDSKGHCTSQYGMPGRCPEGYTCKTTASNDYSTCCKVTCHDYRCGVDCPHGYHTDAYGCKICQCKPDHREPDNGACFVPQKPVPYCGEDGKRYYYNSHVGMCLQLPLHHCAGNENGFMYMDECNRLCDHARMFGGSSGHPSGSSVRSASVALLLSSLLLAIGARL